jgi:Leucine-rich repeat (LRR) protein
LKFGIESKKESIHLISLSKTQILTQLAQIKELEFNFSEFNQINLSNSEIFELLKNLKSLNLQEFDSIDFKIFTKLNSEKLTTLHLKQRGHSLNETKKFESDTFGKLINLVELSLRDCHIEQIDENAFATLKELRKLDLTGNPVNPVGQVLRDSFKEKYSLNRELVLVQSDD